MSSSTRWQPFTLARGQQTPGQRAAEIHARDRDVGLDALMMLLMIAERSTAEAGIVASFLASLYDGALYPFDLGELRRLEEDVSLPRRAAPGPRVRGRNALHRTPRPGALAALVERVGSAPFLPVTEATPRATGYERETASAPFHHKPACLASSSENSGSTPLSSPLIAWQIRHMPFVRWCVPSVTQLRRARSLPACTLEQTELIDTE